MHFLGTCWANAVFMALFYSDGMHKLLINQIPKYKDTRRQKSHQGYSHATFHTQEP